jgi:hypothetical protein
MDRQFATYPSAYLFPAPSDHCNRRTSSHHEGDGKFNNSPELYRTAWKDDWHATQEREVVEGSVL